MRVRNSCAGVAAAIALFAAGEGEAQGIPFVERPFESQVLRPLGQPVIPVYDGWWKNPDGTYNLCFSYFNLNTAQSFDVPRGPGNNLSVPELDGVQPTHFDPVPNPDPEKTLKYRHHWCVFTVQVPATWGDGEERVIWTLATNGDTLSAPGYINPKYVMEELRSSGRNVVAPVVTLDDGSGGQGRNGIFSKPYQVKVGEPFVVATTIQTEPDTLRTWVGWTKHQGPGEVTFAESELISEGSGTVSTTVRFSQPGEYVLRVQAVNDPTQPNNPTGSFEFHCCWTNGYVNVTVTP